MSKPPRFHDVPFEFDLLKEQTRRMRIAEKLWIDMASPICPRNVTGLPGRIQKNLDGLQFFLRMV
jgi:hypothetical protein